MKGETTKSVRVVSNDPDLPQLRLRLKVTVKTILRILPKDRIVINIKRGDAWAQEFKVTSTEGKPFKITSVKSSSRYMSANFKAIKGKTDEQMTYSVKVTVSPDIPTGRFTGTVKIKTDLSKGYTETIRIFGKIKGSISYYPERISLNPNPRITEGQVSRTIHLIESGGKGFKIQGVETNHKDIICKIIPVEQDRSYVLVLIWKGKENKRQVNGELIVSTNNNDMPRITIPYRVFTASRKE